MTKLCIPITATTCDGMVRDARAAIAAGAEMIELRLDFLNFDEDFGILESCLRRLAEYKNKIIITCRIAEEGGHYRGDEHARQELLAFAHMVLGLSSHIDMEYTRWKCATEAKLIQRRPGQHGEGLHLILSRHDFAQTPADLTYLLGEMAAHDCDVIKIAAKADNIIDSIRMLDALREWSNKRATIALTMGETGVITRVLAKKFGAFLTFASLEAGKESAPGQLTIKDMREIYRWDAINPQTKVYGVIGCPVAHSMSPHIHNAAFGQVGHDGVYLHMRVEPGYEAFAEFLDACLARPWLDLRGCSVTIPHKENLLRYVREHGGYVEPLAARIGVANTLVIPPYQGGTEGGPTALSAYNTDYRGALDALCDGLECKPEELKQRTFAVLGAGGASRAIVAGLRDLDCKVAIYNRTADKAQALADEFGATALSWDKRINIEADVAINCTSVGMWPDVDKTPLPHMGLSADLTVFDTIANPIETRLLREAREHGCRTISGVSMFVNQAAAQFELWTGKPAPKDLMREVVMARTGKSC